MSVRDTLQFGTATRTVKELVTAQKMLAVKRAFGVTRFLGASTPGQSLDTGVGLRFDYPQSYFLRICFVAKTTGATTGIVKVNIWTSNELGGASKDFTSFPFIDAESWIESGDTDGLHVSVLGNAVERLYWAQLCFHNITILADPNTAYFVTAGPPHQKLWLEMDGDANISYIRDVMLWEWVPHPDTPYGGRGPISEYAEGVGSKYDIFTGK